MSKPAILAAAVLACAPLVSASSTYAPLGTAPALPDAACQVVGTLDPACGVHAVEPSDMTPLTLADASLPAEAPDAGIAFKDAARIPASILAAPLEHDGRKPLLPALAALLAMVILLPRRPGAS